MTKTIHRIFPQTYRDSISLMQLAARISQGEQIEQAGAVMATEANLALLAEAGLLPSSLKAEPTDLLVVIQGSDSAEMEEALNSFEAALTKTVTTGDESEATGLVQPTSIEMGRL